MGVRAKFKCDRIERSGYTRQVRGPDGVDRLENVEMQTIVLSPVYSPDPAAENRAFWNATPSGEIKLGTINPAAAAYFELHKEYYIDFVRVDPPVAEQVPGPPSVPAGQVGVG